MEEKFLLYLTDDEVVLFRGPQEKLYTFKGTSEDAQRDLQNVLIRAPKIPLRLLIDRSHQDVREEKLPPLPPWDRIRFLIHKKAEWRTQGGFAGYHFLKQDKETYFRWVHIPPNDSLIHWLLWAKSLINPMSVFFVPLEAGNFLKKHLSASDGYQMLLYPTASSSETRHVIFKGNRLLLSRLSQEEEDLKSSLHFLSRNYPNIHENLHVLSLVKKTPSLLDHVTTLTDPKDFIRFLAIQKHPSLVLNRDSPLQSLWVRGGAGIVLLSSLLFTGMNIYQGLDYKTKALVLLAEIEGLKSEAHPLKSRLQDKDMVTLRRTQEHYHQLKSHAVNPLQTFERLAVLLKEHKIRLENLRWHHGQELEMIIGFLMEDKTGELLASRFEIFLASCKRAFPKSQVQVLEAPFNSSTHEIFKSPSNTALPLAQIRIVFL
ncbi:MAG: hypothetical protein BGO67_11995 [Alphaproteobacteria bacterium 41-28]|nr:MAG: hypothetical protein BGO67_11995 [Alphaproteobacteria bacterium 41-28]